MKFEKSQNVKEQYASDKNLNTRINLHEKYSVNKQGFGHWIFEQYAFMPGMRILEIGCGNGSVWPERMENLPERCELILSDFSEGMLDAAKARIGERTGLTYQQINILDIPYGDQQFDAVIANMMLYHVPDIEKALGEVRRVLKQEGIFYCATYGEHGLVEYLEEMFADYGIEHRLNTRFTLQNGTAILNQAFANVQKLEYEDAFAVTETHDLLTYIKSMTSMADYHGIEDDVILSRLEERKENGIIHIPKEYGMFIARA